MKMKLIKNNVLAVYGEKNKTNNLISLIKTQLYQKNVDFETIDTFLILENFKRLDTHNKSLSFLQDDVLDLLKECMVSKKNEFITIINGNGLREDQLNGALKFFENELFMTHQKVKTNEFQIKNIDLTIDIVKSESDYNDIHGPFDIIGDIHGCYDELFELLLKLGYIFTQDTNRLSGYKISHPDNRKIISLGDLCDRGTQNMNVMKLVMDIVSQNMGYCILGNHDIKIIKYLEGNKISEKHGWYLTRNEIDQESLEFKNDMLVFLKSLPSHIVLDDHKLVCCHAGIRENMIGKEGGVVKKTCCFGEDSGEKDENGFTKYKDWQNEYNGSQIVAFGHVWRENLVFVNNTIGLDTGCVFGDFLTGMRYPELTFENIKAKVYYFRDLKKPENIKALNDKYIF